VKYLVQFMGATVVEADSEEEALQLDILGRDARIVELQLIGVHKVVAPDSAVVTVVDAEELFL
jgi:hypothetical protein